MKREPGYYWVRQYDFDTMQDLWHIGEYAMSWTGDNHWYLHGSDESYSDHHFTEINEKRITSPAESQGENKQ
jgi:hypothetical protein